MFPKKSFPKAPLFFCPDGIGTSRDAQISAFRQLWDKPKSNWRELLQVGNAFSLTLEKKRNQREKKRKENKPGKF